MAIILRTSKGIPLTHSELDGNFSDLNTRLSTIELATNSAQTLSLVGNALSISNGNTVSLSNLSFALTDLSNVDTTGATSGQVLKFDGASWVAAAETGGSSYTDSDVDTHLNTSTATSGQILSWDGTDYVWVADQTGGGGSASVSVQETAPGTPSEGDLWWKSDVGRLKVYYEDGTSSQWVDASPAIQGAVGFTGSAGPAGGYTGSAGVQGDIGYTGSQGDIGYTGSQGDPGSRTFNVTAAGFQNYIIDGADDPTLNLLRGFTYTFDINATNHPFWFQTVDGAYSAGDVYTTGQTVTGTREVGTITFSVPYDAPSTLYYVCQYHSNMLGTVLINDVGPIGYTGSAGTQGDIGYTGSAGSAGDIGYTGSAGTQGDIGYTGSQGDAGYRIFDVTNSGTSGYVIDGTLNATISLLRGFTYEFDMNTSSANHPIAFQTVSGPYSAGDVYTTGQTVTGNGSNEGSVIFAVPYDAPSQLYYACQNHSAMNGAINISDVGPIGYTGSAGAQGDIGYTGSAGSGGASVTISDNPPGSATAGDLWWESDIGKLKVYYDDSTSSQWVDASPQVTGYTGSAGSAGDIGYTGSAGTQGDIGYTGSAGASTDTLNDVVQRGASTSTKVELTGGLDVSGLDLTLLTHGITEHVVTYNAPTGIVNYDAGGSNIFWNVAPLADWTANIINVTLPIDFAKSFVFPIVQGEAPAMYLPLTLQIAGVPQTIKWADGTPPTATGNAIDVVSFNVINIAGTYQVMGSLVSFS